VLRPTIIHRSDSGDTDSDDNDGNNAHSFAQLSVMSRPQLATTYDRQQRQYRKRIASASAIEHNPALPARIMRLPLEFSQPDTADDDPYTYVITQPQSNASPSPTNDENRG
jgi:hypothetical protein